MKISKISVPVFLSAFLIGFAFVPKAEQGSQLMPSLVVAPPVIPVQPILKDFTSETLVEKAEDWREEDTSEFKIKLLEVGEGFHGDEVEAKSGERWLGLFQEGDKYFLRRTKLKINRVYDPVVDGENEKIKTGKSVYTDRKAKSAFLLKNAKSLSEGEIRTVFFAEDISEATELKNRSRRDYEFNGEKYSLRVENKITPGEFLGAGSKLILSRGGADQTLIYLKDGCSDCSWNLFWAGDLDRDGKLDFYFDLSTHYNVSDRRLFLSSKVKKGELVKYSANFTTTGC